MSAMLSGIFGGQPSTTQPIATPWLSPKVVTRKRWPNVLKDIRICPRRARVVARAPRLVLLAVCHALAQPLDELPGLLAAVLRRRIEVLGCEPELCRGKDEVDVGLILVRQGIDHLDALVPGHRIDAGADHGRNEP